jgi:hypothetical protein
MTHDSCQLMSSMIHAGQAQDDHKDLAGTCQIEAEHNVARETDR